jgi:putative endonuclease
MRFVYIVRCKDNSLYTWITNNLQRRIKEHNFSNLWAKYTYNKRPVKLIWNKEVENRSEASKLEIEIKKMKKEDKEKLIINQLCNF